MAKLKSIKFHHKNETGEVMEFSSNVTIDGDGTFNVTIPDELHGTATRIPKTVDVGLTKPANSHSWRVSGKRLDDCQSFINTVLEDYLKCEIATERVIVYGYSMKVCYTKHANGGIYANGYICEDENGKDSYNDARHGGELHATNTAPLYSVGLGAKVFDRVTYSRASGKTVVYKSPKFPGSHLVHDSPAKRLNAFAALSINPDRQDTQEMPYSDEAAAFFYDAMIAMCKLADQVNAFLGDKQSLMLAIERRAALLPAPQPKAA